MRSTWHRYRFDHSGGSPLKVITVPEHGYGVTPIPQTGHGTENTAVSIRACRACSFQNGVKSGKIIGCGHDDGGSSGRLRIWLAPDDFTKVRDVEPWSVPVRIPGDVGTGVNVTQVGPDVATAATSHLGRMCQ